MLQRMDERLLKEICKYLKPVTYQEEQCIMEEGRPLDKMLFIRQGMVRTYRTHDKGDKGIKICNSRVLEQGDVYGEELLHWVSRFTSSSANLPKSTRNVKSVNKVDVFALKAGDLETVVKKCWWHFTKDKFLYQYFNPVQLELLKKFAVSAIERQVIRIKTQPTKNATVQGSKTWRRAAGMIVKDHVPIGAPSKGMKLAS